jgi:hypothetical protein
MSLQEWERDIRNRQRNIVFPDTVLNEARFFRNLVSGRTALKPVQRTALLLIAAPMILGGCVGIAYSIGSFLATKDTMARVLSLLSSVGAIIILAFGIILAVRGLLPATAPARKRRGGYRQSGRV